MLAEFAFAQVVDGVRDQVAGLDHIRPGVGCPGLQAREVEQVPHQAIQAGVIPPARLLAGHGALPDEARVHALKALAAAELQFGSMLSHGRNRRLASAPPRQQAQRLPVALVESNQQRG